MRPIKGFARFLERLLGQVALERLLGQVAQRPTGIARVAHTAGGLRSGGRVGVDRYLPGLPASAPSQLGRGHSIGARIEPADLNEQLAMTEARSNPHLARVIGLKKGMTDPRWPQHEGWQKVTYYRHDVQIHFVRNDLTNEIDDFKFVEP